MSAAETPAFLPDPSTITLDEHIDRILAELDEIPPAPSAAASRRLAAMRESAAVPVLRVRPRRLLWVAYACCGAVVALAAAWRWV